MARDINQAGLELLKREEGLRLEAYKDSRGVWTIGYGHTSAAGPPQVTPGLQITQRQAEALFRRDLDTFERCVSIAIKRPINDNQYAALVSLAYNIGPHAFANSRVVKKFNAGDIAGASLAILAWKRAGNDPDILLGRRRRERRLFDTPIAKPPSLPSPEAQTPVVNVVTGEEVPLPGPAEVEGTSWGKWGVAASAAGSAGYAVSSFSMTDWRVIAVLTGAVMVSMIIAFWAMGYERREKFWSKLFD